MRRLPFALLLALSVTSLWAAPAAPVAKPAATPSAKPAVKPAAESPLSARATREDAIYKVGEAVEFAVRVKAGSPAEVTYQLSEDGATVLASGKLVLTDGAGVIRGAMDKPGFLRCQVAYRDGAKTATALAGAAIDPLAIRPSLPVPDDFDAFWDAQKAKLAAVPMRSLLTPVASNDATVDAFDVQVTCAGGKPVSGYFARPKGAKPKSLPAVLSVHGAGVRGSVLPAAVGMAKAPALGMDINAHGIPNGKPASFYTQLNEGELKDYRFTGREDREKCYFLGMFLRLIRAIDFLTAQPEWDGKMVVVQGSSQGGGQSIAAAGLDARVTFIAAGVPAICDHSGSAAGRINGWPKLVPNDEQGRPDANILQVARYFDCMNLASRTRAGAIVSVGFIDTVCPATSVYAAYNALGGPKHMVNVPTMGHAQTPFVGGKFREAVMEHYARQAGR